jgi:Flp pilus assembly pilin Flp
MNRASKEHDMRNRLDQERTERGATLVEYSMLLALFALAMLPAVSVTKDAIADSQARSVSHFATTAYTFGNDDGGGGGDGTTTTTTLPPTTTTTTVPPTTTTTTLPPTTTTTTVPPTTTTVPPTTTTTTIPPNQTSTATYEDEVSVTFNETDGVVTNESIEADGWTYEIIEDSGTKVHLKFTRKDPDKSVVMKGWIDETGNLKTNVADK